MRSNIFFCFASLLWSHIRGETYEKKNCSLPAPQQTAGEHKETFSSLRDNWYLVETKNGGRRKNQEISACAGQSTVGWWWCTFILSGAVCATEHIHVCLQSVVGKLFCARSSSKCHRKVMNFSTEEEKCTDLRTEFTLDKRTRDDFCLVNSLN